MLKKERRPKTYLTDEQKKIIEEVWRETKVEVRLLYAEQDIRVLQGDRKEQDKE